MSVAKSLIARRPSRTGPGHLLLEEGHGPLDGPGVVVPEGQQPPRQGRLERHPRGGHQPGGLGAGGGAAVVGEGHQHPVEDPPLPLLGHPSLEHAKPRIPGGEAFDPGLHGLPVQNHPIGGHLRPFHRHHHSPSLPRCPGPSPRGSSSDSPSRGASFRRSRRSRISTVQPSSSTRTSTDHPSCLPHKKTRLRSRRRVADVLPRAGACAPRPCGTPRPILPSSA